MGEKGASYLLLLLIFVPALLQAAPQFPDTLDLSEYNDLWIEWRVRSVVCHGLEITDSTTVLRELELLPGAGYNDVLLQEDANAVKNTGIFARLAVSVSPDSVAEAVDIIYAVQERPAYFVLPILETRSANKLSYGFKLYYINLFGKGQHLTLKMIEGGLHSYQVGFSNPWLFRKKQRFNVIIKHLEKNNPAEDYWVENNVAALGLSEYLTREFQVNYGIFWRYSSIIAYEEGLEKKTVNPDGADNFGGVNAGFRINTTDLYVNPHHGSNIYSGVTFFGLSGRNHPAGTSCVFSASKFFPYSEKIVLGLNLQSSFIAGRRPEYLRTFLGGENGVRSGATGSWENWSQLVTHCELRFQMMKRRVVFHNIDIGIDGVLFADGGIGWQEIYTGENFAAGGLGAGLRFFVPFIDVGRFDTSWSPNHGLMFSIGTGHIF
jgi:outer membrane protein assembly factor BamA